MKITKKICGCEDWKEGKVHGWLRCDKHREKTYCELELAKADKRLTIAIKALEKYTDQKTYGYLRVGDIIPCSIAIKALNALREVK